MMQAATGLSTFGQALEFVASLPAEQQEAFIETVELRLREQRRTELARESREALQEILAGGGSSGTAEDFKREFLAEL
jgi:hypothetical protein